MYFEEKAVWLCARCEDVGSRNGRKLAHMAEDQKQVLHQIHAEHSSPHSEAVGRCFGDSFTHSLARAYQGCVSTLPRSGRHPTRWPVGGGSEEVPSIAQVRSLSSCHRHSRATRASVIPRLKVSQPPPYHE